MVKRLGCAAAALTLVLGLLASCGKKQEKLTAPGQILIIVGTQAAMPEEARLAQKMINDYEPGVIWIRTLPDAALSNK
ncbi:MAG: hypothetical protein LBQ33_03715, partial [Oscillospiraceae bacterium]|nr:hypothetical protein [Oscillospiraceae bacterium]